MMIMMMMAEKSIGSREQCIKILTRIVLVYAESPCSKIVVRKVLSVCRIFPFPLRTCNRDYTSSFSAVTFYQLGK
jgi:hypothetical protein